MMGINEVLGKTIAKIDKTDEEIIFTLIDGVKYKMYHDQDCCESVTIEDIVGDLNDLIGLPILRASEDTNAGETDNSSGDTSTWTFYNLATKKGHVTIRWFGTSNGYYSESVKFIKL